MDCGHRTIAPPLRVCWPQSAAVLLLTLGLLLSLVGIAAAQSAQPPAREGVNVPGQAPPEAALPPAPGPAPGEALAVESRGVETAAAFVRTLNYAGMMLAVGGIAFLLLVHDRRGSERRALTGLVMVGVALTAGGSVFGLFVQGPFVTGLGTGAMLDPTMLSTVLATKYGDAVVIRLTGLGVLLIALPYLWNRWAILTSSLAGAAIIASFVVSATYSPDLPYWLVVASSLSHKLSAAAWFGGLILLVASMRRRRARNDALGGARLVARFSLFATASIVLVTAAGLGMTWVRVPTFSDLITTSYGWMLIAKVAIFGLVLAVGAYNHHFLVPAIERGLGAGDAWKRMERLIRCEVVGIVVVVLITVALVQLTPAPRDAEPAGSFATSAQLDEERWLELAVNPDGAGANDVSVQLRGADGQPIDDAAEPTLAFYLPAGEVAPVQGVPEKVGPGAWVLRGQELPAHGDCRVAVRMRTGATEQLTAEVSLAAAP